MGTNQVKMKTLTLWDWHTAQIPKVVGKIHSQFKRKYSIALQVKSFNFSELPEKIINSAKTGQLPDVMEIWAPALIPKLAELGCIEPLDSYVEREGGEKFLNNFEDWAITRYKGKSYSLPIYACSIGLFYNKTMFEQASITHPPRTWEELVSVAKKLTNQKEGRYGFALNGADLEMLYSLTPFIAQNGGRVGKMDGEVQINSPRTVEAIGFVVDLINKHKVIPSYTTTDSRKAREMFLRGKVGMLYESTAVCGVIKYANPQFKWGTALLPKGITTGTALSVGDTEYAISSKTERKKEAWKFIRFMTEEENIHFWASNVPMLPSTRNTYQREDIKKDLYLEPFLKQLRLPNAIDVYCELPFQLSEAVELFRAEMRAVVAGHKKIKEGMDDVARKWEKLYMSWDREHGTQERNGG